MGVRKDMRELANLTERELEIRNFILQNPEKVSQMSARELGEITFSSAASVVRFCQKLGFKGFPEFKLEFSSELKLDKDENPIMDHGIGGNESVVTVLDKITELHKLSVSETKKELSLNAMLRVAKEFHKANYIDFYAYDLNVYIAQYACNQLFHSGKIANVYYATNIQELHALMKKEGHIAVIISHTGENSRLIEVTKTLKRNGTKVIVITGEKYSTLASMANEAIYAFAPKTSDGKWQPGFVSSVNYIFDILIGMEFSMHYDSNIELTDQYEAIGMSTLWGLAKDVELRKQYAKDVESLKEDEVE